MKPIKISLIGICLFFLVLCGIAFTAMMAIGNYIIAAIDFIAVVQIAITIVMVIIKKIHPRNIF